VIALAWDNDLQRRLGFFKVVYPTIRKQQTERACCRTVPSVKVSRGVNPKETYTRSPNVEISPLGKEFAITTTKKK
jgi:hypothetical protein